MTVLRKYLKFSLTGLGTSGLKSPQESAMQLAKSQRDTYKKKEYGKGRNKD